MRIVISNYEYVDDMSEKFWRSFVFDNFWIAQWGRIGSDGQFKVYEGTRGSEQAAHAKQREKLNKGYRLRGGIRVHNLGVGSVDAKNIEAWQLSGLWRQGILLPSRENVNAAVADLLDIREGLA